MVEKIKIYDVRSWVEKEMKEDNLSPHMYDELAIIIGPKDDVLIFEKEGVGWIQSHPVNKFNLPLSPCPKKDENGNMSFSMIATHTIKISAQEIMDNCEYREDTLAGFIKKRNYNSRLKSNWSSLLKNIDEMGLDRKDYHQE